MKIIKFNKNIYNQLQIKIEKRNSSSNKLIQDDVKKIIYDVKKNGDKALIKYAAKFDKVKISKKDLSFDLSKTNSKSKIDPQIFNSFKKAIKNISSFHKRQLPKNIIYKNNGITLKSEWKPIDSVGLYVPGGKAFYPSSLIMNAVPAIIAGIKSRKENLAAFSGFIPKIFEIAIVVPDLDIPGNIAKPWITPTANVFL